MRVWSWLLARAILGGIFLTAGASKVGYQWEFAVAINHYHILPISLVPLAATILPFVEMLAGLCLLVGFWSDSSALLLGGLSVVFMGASINTLMRGIDISCGCFRPGLTRERLGWLHVGLNLALFMMAIVVLRFRLPEPLIAKIRDGTDRGQDEGI